MFKQLFRLTLLLISFSFPCQSKDSFKKIAPYLLPAGHPMKAPLDAIFMDIHILDNADTFIQAGFIPIYYHAPSSFIVASHPTLPGYLVKAYLDSQEQLKDEQTGFDKLASRCKGAANVRNLIAKKKLQHFVVPDKWIYLLPNRGLPLLLPQQNRRSFSS